MLDRRRFLEAAAVLAAAAPLSGAGARTMAPPADGVAMAEAVRRRRVTPAALVEGAIARLERVNPKLNAVAFANYDRARAQARAAASGPLAGVPTLIKDNKEQAGLPYTDGCRALRRNVPTATAPEVAAIERAGLIPIGRSTLPEFGALCTTEPLLTGVTRNPWSLDHTPGGSSGGSAACVAAGVVPFAHANDGGGSIRIPASNCGLVGLKPSRARMRGQEGRVTPVSFAVDGCVSRTVRDTAAWFAACESPTPGLGLTPVGLVTGPSRARLRVGVQMKGVSGDPHPDVTAVCEQARRLLARLGHRVTDVPFPADADRVAESFETLWYASIGQQVQGVARRVGRQPGPQDFEPATLAMAAEAERLGKPRVDAAVAAMVELTRAYVGQFDAIDVYMTPTLALPPVAIGEIGPNVPFDQLKARLRRYVAYTPIENATGCPAISLPIGLSSAGLPIGVQFATRPGGERTLLELAYALERELEWHRRRPQLWAA